MIEKPRSGWRVAPNMPVYDETRASFSWAAAERELTGLPGGKGLNIAHEAVDRHCLQGRGGRHALRWRGRHGERKILTYAELSTWTNRFAQMLAGLGIQPGHPPPASLGNRHPGRAGGLPRTR